MSTEKVSLTLEKELLAEARTVAGGRALSRYLNRALRNQLQRDRIAGLLAEVEREQRAGRGRSASRAAGATPPRHARPRRFTR